ncbi:MAG TPA: hypothetical protein VG184_11425 [Acidimicrobiales bacterium]|nr:hypothetical protein [Acidimicrobiales bacterium]
MTVLPALAMIAGSVALASPASATPQTLACGSTVTQNTLLRADVGPCAGTGITIGASNITLNLNGHHVFGALNSYGTGPVDGTDKVGIHFDSVTNSRVMNGEVSGFAAGVRIDNGSGNAVTLMNVHDNITAIHSPAENGDGISVWNSSYNRVSHNTVTHNGEYSGISLLTGPYNAVNGVVNPAMSGTGNDITDNVVTNNNVAVCSNATCKPAATPGVTFVRGQQIPGSNDEGIDVNGPNMTNSVVRGNYVTDSGNNGIMVNPSCHDAFLVAKAQTTCSGDVGNVGTLIQNNVADHNGYGRTTGFGINLFGMGLSKAVEGSFDTVEGNTTDHNKDGGIILYSSSCNDLANNAAAQCAAVNDTVVHNTSSFNGLSLGVNTSQGDGIEMSAGANNNNVSHNTLIGNDSDGIGVEMAQMYDANGPVVDANGNPVYIPGSGASNNTLAHNQAMGNHYFDAEDQNPGCDHNQWVHNEFGTVNQPCVAG